MSSLIRFNFILHDAERLLLKALLKISKDDPRTKGVFDSLKNAQSRENYFHNWENILLCIKFIDESVKCPIMREMAMVATMFKDSAFSPFVRSSKVWSADNAFYILKNILGVSDAVAKEIRHSIHRIDPPSSRHGKYSELDKLVMDLNFVRLASKWEVFLEISKAVLSESGYPRTAESLLIRGRYFRQNFPMTKDGKKLPIFLSAYTLQYEAAARKNIDDFLQKCKQHQ